MPPRRAIGLAAFALLAAAAQPAGAQSLVVIGGGLEDPAIYDRIIQLGGGPEKARIGILTTGSATPQQNGSFYVDAFAARGARAEWLPLDGSSPGGADDPALAAQAAGCNVFFLGGGDQRRYTRALLGKGGRDTALLRVIRQAFEAGGVVAGTSAGAAVLVDAPMVTGGESYDALARPRRVTSRRGGLGLFRFGLIDTHFAERGRQGRMIRLAARHGIPLAFGVDEDTALVVTDALGSRPGMRVVGRGGVSVFDLTRARASRRGRWRIDNVRSHYLLAGDSFSAADRRFRAGSGRARDRTAVKAEPSDQGDIFSAVDPKAERRLRPRSFIRTAQSAMSPGSPAASAHPAEDGSWRVSLRRGRGAARYRGGSYRNLRIDIGRVGQGVRAAWRAAAGAKPARPGRPRRSGRSGRR